mgnify:CR=1 FL=1
MSDKDAVRVTICMGSSCFARGNRAVLGAVQAMAKQSGVDGRLELVGSRCEGQCRCGPNLRIDGQLHQDVDPGTALDLLRARLGRAG